MKLSEYLSTHAIRPSHFAVTLGVATSTVTRWIGGMPPSMDMMRRILHVTDGAVTANDFLRQDGAK